MSFESIVQQLFQYVMPAPILVCIVLTLAGVGYFFIYKKLLKGNKTINKTKVILGIILIIYLMVVFGLTCNRGAGFVRTVNLKLFSSYIDAWNTFTVRAWQFIIFNIIMFIPLGILLPLLNRIFTKVRWILLAAFLTTLSIEALQLIAGLGFFELDDLFHNTLGGMIGYCILMFGYRMIKGNKKRVSATGFLVLPTVIILAFVGIFVKYNLQEFGNMPVRQVSGADISKYTIELSVDISNKESVAPVYKYPNSWDKEFAISEAQKVMKDLNLPAFKSYLIQGEDIFFNFENSSHCSFTWDRSNGAWDYANHAVERDNEKVTLTDDEKYKIALEFAKSHNILLNDAIWDSTSKYNITFKINPDTYGKTKMRSGQVVFDISNDGVISGIRHEVYENSFVRNVNIISPQSAYQKVLKGNFYDWPDMPGGKIEIKNIKISYSYDTKGFYQPVYEFTGTLNGEKWGTYVAAMK